MHVLEAFNIGKTYRRGKNAVEAVRNLSIAVEDGEMISVTGRSGCGKTTLINMLGLLELPTEGRIVLKGCEVKASSMNELTRKRRENFGFVFQQFNLIPHLTAQENVALPLKYCGVSYAERMKRAREMLDMVNLEKRKEYKWHELSGGEAQRVAVARALINNPSVLFADEPTSELDTETSKELLELLMRIREELKTTMIIVSHDLNITSYATRILKMNDGNIES